MAVNRYGLLDINAGENYVLQGHTSVPAEIQTQSDEPVGQSGGVLVAGNLGNSAAKSIVSAAPETGLSILSVDNASAYRAEHLWTPALGPTTSSST